MSVRAVVGTAALMLTMLSCLAPAQAQPQPLEYFSGTGHWYQVIVLLQPENSWVKSRDSAVALGGYLVSILSQEENDFVRELLNSAPAQVLFGSIGGYERNGENDWQWVSGEPWSYTNWNTGEPNNLCSPNPGCENMVQIYGHTDPSPPSGTWVDGDSLTPDQPGVGSFIVEYDCVCPHQADIDASAFIDAVDLAVEIDIVFFGAADVQDPGCLTTRADFNNDGVADAVDLALLIDHVFFGGAGPSDPCAP